MFHYLIEDMPHALVVIAAELDCRKGEEHCLQEGTLNIFKWDTGIEHSIIAILSLCFSLGSILFGLANKTVRMPSCQWVTVCRLSLWATPCAAASSGGVRTLS
jgi:hypothetical protein